MAPGSDLYTQLAAVGFVLMLLAGTVFLLRRRGWLHAMSGIHRGDRKQGCSIESQARLILTAHHSLFVVCIHGRQFLVATSPSNATISPLEPDFHGTLHNSLQGHQGGLQ